MSRAANQVVMLVGLGSALAVGLALPRPAAAFLVNGRWPFTATDGTTAPQGKPVTLTWSIVPDGTTISSRGQAPSSLVSFLDSLWGVDGGGTDYQQRPWFGLVETSFSRWSEVSGIVLEYEPADDGLSSRSHGQWLGLTGVRGDIRLGGTAIDGPSGALGEAGFIPNGDIILDTTDAAHFGNPDPAASYRNLRNTLTHEVGHSLGLGHPISPNSAFLMESGFNGTFDGPQYDDVRGVHHLYGDVLERGGGNDSGARASDLGVIPPGTTRLFGADGDSGVGLAPDQSDFLSISSSSDVDFFELTLTEPSLLDLVLTPVGPRYNEFVFPGPVADVVSAAQNDLTLELYEASAGGMTLLASRDAAGLAGAESLLDFDAGPGSYLVRVAGRGDDVQLYTLALEATAAPGLSVGDFNDDGVVDAADYTRWRDNLGASDDSALLFRGDGAAGVNADDYLVWASNYGATYTAAGQGGASAPEPTTALTLLAGLALVAASSRRGSQG